MFISKTMLNATKSTRLPRYSQTRTILTSSITDLQAAFRDPSSPFHIPPGTQGPESPDSPLTHTAAHFTTVATPEAMESAAASPESLEEARGKLVDAGMDPSLFGNNILFGGIKILSNTSTMCAIVIRFFESARIKWMMSLGTELGGPARAKAMISGKGISLILKSIDVKFRRPVTYPDTLLIGYRPLPPVDPHHDTATFYVQASAYSLGQKAFVAHSKEALVWYDYDRLRKGEPGEEAKAVLFGRIGKS